VYEHEKKYYKNETVKVYNWYNSNCFYPAQNGEKEKIRAELNIPREALVLMSVGGCSPIKRHWEIINALPAVIQKFPNTVYFHLGEGSTLHEEFDLVKTLQLTDNVRFFGNQTDVRKFLIASDIYLMTSKLEGISLTTIEAMACNIPAILYDVPGLRDFNREEECVVLIPEDHTLLAENITRLYEDQDKQSELIISAKQLVDRCFNMKINATKIFELYARTN